MLPARLALPEQKQTPTRGTYTIGMPDRRSPRPSRRKHPFSDVINHTSPPCAIPSEIHDGLLPTLETISLFESGVGRLCPVDRPTMEPQEHKPVCGKTTAPQATRQEYPAWTTNRGPRPRKSETSWMTINNHLVGFPDQRRCSEQHTNKSRRLMAIVGGTPFDRDCRALKYACGGVSIRDISQTNRATTCWSLFKTLTFLSGLRGAGEHGIEVVIILAQSTRVPGRPSVVGQHWWRCRGMLESTPTHRHPQ
ncbi:hypothetical protein LX36DRAFT_370564 [Colletotrichum falcatum]|nr:hypothetical protein LX36DRAFT_370564 [Colletotrichum falcatum]